MSNAKRAIMVPVMTLAVCAIAMVGLGFALTTSVTSNTNDLEKLMIDLDSDYSNIGGQYAPDDTDVNSLFDYRITSGKSSDTEAKTITINYKLESKESYLKVFSNNDTKKATLKVSGTGLATSEATDAGSITQVVLGLYETKSNGSIKDGAKAYATVDSTSNPSYVAFFGNPGQDTNGNSIFNNYEISSGTVYIVKVDKVTIDGIQYVSGSTGITITKNAPGSDPAYSISDSGTTAVTGFPSFNGTYGSLGFTFTAEANPEA